MDQCVEPVSSADGDITQLLRQWSDGHDESFRALMSVAYGRLRLIAGASMCHERPDHTLQPTALVGELYLRLAGAKLADWKDREHFYSFCARAMRWILTDHARARAREKRQIGRLLPLSIDIRWLGELEEDAIDLDYALSRLEEFDSRKAKSEETAGILNLSKATVDRDMKLACAWLCRELRPEE
jgi:RNA polymerase sigma factor (TIGR02999 family)